MRHLPNALSMGRLVLTLPLVVLILINTPPAYVAATIIFFIGSVSDTIDGRIARKYHLVSNLGVFLDLTADKVLVSALLIALVQVAAVPAWIVIVIVTREFAVSGLRALAAAQGVVISARRWGKQKTLLTLLGIGGIILTRGLGARTAFPLGLSTATHGPLNFPDDLLVVADVLLLLAVVWTVFSAYEYVQGAWGLLTSAPTADEDAD